MLNVWKIVILILLPLEIDIEFMVYQKDNI